MIDQRVVCAVDLAVKPFPRHAPRIDNVDLFIVPYRKSEALLYFENSVVAAAKLLFDHVEIDLHGLCDLFRNLLVAVKLRVLDLGADVARSVKAPLVQAQFAKAMREGAFVSICA